MTCVTVVQGQKDWTVTCTPTSICATKGSTVKLNCTYKLKKYTSFALPEEKIWYTKWNGQRPVDLTTDGDYTDRVTNSCHMNTCTLTIRNVRESDSSVYRFKLLRSSTVERYYYEPGVTLSVTGKISTYMLIISICSTSRKQYYLNCICG